MRVSTNACTAHTLTFTRTNAFTHTHTHKRIHTHTHTHTFTHTNTFTHSPCMNTRHLISTIQAEHANTTAPNDDVLDVTIVLGRIQDDCSRSGGSVVAEPVCV